MIEYIYFVKCPDCEDEYFNFFDEAKEYALGCLDNKPIITQTEVCRNDFGECTDSNDLGAIWSWEDMMTDVSADEPAASVFTHGDFAEYNPDRDPEFDALDNSVDFESETSEVSVLDEIPDNFRKPIPEGMTIEQLVEAMEENEDTVECVCCNELYPKEDCKHDEKHGWICPDCADEVVECTWCEELYDRSQCRYEVDMGWLCDHCEAAIKSRGETLTFRENNYLDFLDEAFNGKEAVEFDYNDLEVTLLDNKQDRETGTYGEHEETVHYTYTVSKYDVAVDMWEHDLITEEDVLDVPGGLNTLEDEDALHAFLKDHFDILLDKYYDQLLEIYRDSAAEAYESNTSYEEYWQDGYDDYIADRHADDRYDESIKPVSKLEELEESEDYKKRLSLCPECGSNSFDPETGFCINCGFEL